MYWRAKAKQLAELDCISGGTPAKMNAEDLNVDWLTLKSAIIAKRNTDEVAIK